MPRAKQRTEQLRERVLSAAIVLLERDGVGSFTARRLAEAADTSLPAVYELFGDKAGVVRQVFFHGFRLLATQLQQAEFPDEPRAALMTALLGFRSFIVAHPVLAEIMFSRPFADFQPTAADMKAGKATRDFMVGCVRRCIEAKRLTLDAIDVSHVLVALVQGLAAQENGGWLGTSKASIERRWRLALESALDGLLHR